MIVRQNMHNVRLYGWQPGAIKILATETIRKHVSMGLAQAKEIVDRTLDGKVTGFTFDSFDAARSFANDMQKVGFLTEIIKADTGETVIKDTPH